VITVNNGNDAIEQSKNRNFDIVFLDENMAGHIRIETHDTIEKYQTRSTSGDDNQERGRINYGTGTRQ
jgi:CheY-like chemotaxis protein